MHQTNQSCQDMIKRHSCSSALYLVGSVIAHGRRVTSHHPTSTDSCFAITAFLPYLYAGLYKLLLGCIMPSHIRIGSKGQLGTTSIKVALNHNNPTPRVEKKIGSHAIRSTDARILSFGVYLWLLCVSGLEQCFGILLVLVPAMLFETTWSKTLAGTSGPLAFSRSIFQVPAMLFDTSRVLSGVEQHGRDFFKGLHHFPLRGIILNLYQVSGLGLRT